MFPVCHKHITASPRLRNGHLLAILPNGQDARPPLRSCFGPMASDLDGVVRSCRRPRCRAACPERAGQPGIHVATRFPRHRPLHPSPPDRRLRTAGGARGGRGRSAGSPPTERRARGVGVLGAHTSRQASEKANLPAASALQAISALTIHRPRRLRTAALKLSSTGGESLPFCLV